MVFKYTTSYLVMICYFNYAWLLVGVGVGVGRRGVGVGRRGEGAKGRRRRAKGRSVIQQSSRQPPHTI